MKGRSDLETADVARVARLLGVLMVALLVANCSSTVAGRRTKDYGVKASPRVVEEGQPVPKGGGREMVGKPYVVGGRTYVPSGGKGYRREGYASWYGSAFHGRLTANGEIFDRQSVAAAHPTLPLPSYVRVTNLANHRSMLVRVNDRGPYEAGRLIDVSERAADALGFRRSGVTRVRVEYAGRAALSGSDDAKLLATLRTEDDPVAAGHRERVMVAERDDDETERPVAHAAPRAPVPPSTARVVVAANPPMDTQVRRYAVVHPEDRPPVRVAAVQPPPQTPAHVSPTRGAVEPARVTGAAEPAARSPVTLPPQRPTLSGIY